MRHRRHKKSVHPLPPGRGPIACAREERQAGSMGARAEAEPSGGSEVRSLYAENSAVLRNFWRKSYRLGFSFNKANRRPAHAGSAIKQRGKLQTLTDLPSLHTVCQDVGGARFAVYNAVQRCRVRAGGQPLIRPLENLGSSDAFRNGPRTTNARGGCALGHHLHLAGRSRAPVVRPSAIYGAPSSRVPSTRWMDACRSLASPGQHARGQ